MRFLLFSTLIIITSLSHAQECGEKIVAPVLSDQGRKQLEEKLQAAKQEYEMNSSDADALIWYGRRMAYTGDYTGAIELFTKGIAQHPGDARLYRHRGHRYLTIRCVDKAIADFEQAARLIKGRPDEVEPDGMPNEKNIPTSTLQSNIWYHLGLCYYLKGNYDKAREAYVQCLAVSKNPDMYVATANWMFVTLKKLKKEKEAGALLATVNKDMDLIENKDYLRILLLYKLESDPQQLEQELSGGAQSLSNASMGYGLGNFYLLTGNSAKAKEIFSKIISGSQWSSFGFIAAEAELKRF